MISEEIYQLNSKRLPTFLVGKRLAAFETDLKQLKQLIYGILAPGPIASS